MVCHCFHISVSLRGMWFKRRIAEGCGGRIDHRIAVHRPLGQLYARRTVFIVRLMVEDLIFFTKYRTTNAPRSVRANTVCKPRASCLWRQMVGWASELPEHPGIEALGRVWPSAGIKGERSGHVTDCALQMLQAECTMFLWMFIEFN